MFSVLIMIIMVLTLINKIVKSILVDGTRSHVKLLRLKLEHTGVVAVT